MVFWLFQEPLLTKIKVAEQGTVLALIEGMALCDDNIGEDDQDNVVEAIMRDWEEVLLRRVR